MNQEWNKGYWCAFADSGVGAHLLFTIKNAKEPKCP